MFRMSRSAAVLAAALAGSVAAGAAEAQVPVTPRALGLGGAIGAGARGFESVLYNPALLGLGDTPDWSVAFPQVTIGSSILGPDVADLPDFFNFDDLSPERKEELLGLIPDNGTSLDLDVRAPVAAVQVGRVGLALSYMAVGGHTVGKDLVELFFDGYQEGRYDYSVANTGGYRATLWDLAAGYGRALGPLSVGVTGHYYKGRTLMRSQAFQTILPLEERIEVEYVGVASEGGSGYGVDVGAALQLAGLTLSGSVANLTSSMEWDEELVGRNLLLTNEDFDAADPMELEDRYQHSETELGTAPSGRFATVAQQLDPEAYTLPTTVRFGAAYSVPTGTQLSAAYQKQVGDGLLGDRWEQMAGVGVQQRLLFLTLRAGASTNLDGGNMVGGGLRLGPVDLGVARFQYGEPAEGAADRDGWAASFSVNIRTQGTLRN